MPNRSRPRPSQVACPAPSVVAPAAIPRALWFIRPRRRRRVDGLVSTRGATDAAHTHAEAEAVTHRDRLLRPPPHAPRHPRPQKPASASSTGAGRARPPRRRDERGPRVYCLRDRPPQRRGRPLRLHEPSPAGGAARRRLPPTLLAPILPRRGRAASDWRGGAVLHGELAAYGMDN